MDITTTRMVLLGALAVVFALTVLLMPRIFGDNPQAETPETPKVPATTPPTPMPTGEPAVPPR